MADPQKILTNLTTKPGVYQMFNADGKVIYVGKARNLKKRLSSYFRKNLSDTKTGVLMSKVADIQVTITNDEVEALLLEANLIKRYRPRYNVLLRDDKSYPYLYLSTQDKFPRLDFHRGAKKKKGHYFGPYPSAGAVRDNLALIQKLFQLRQCKDSFFRNRSRPCLQYQIKRCTAPCVKYVSETDYRHQVDLAILFLEGKSFAVTETLQEKMNAASKAQHYEMAALYRDQIMQLRQLQRQQKITGDQGDIDIIGIAQEQGSVAISVIFVRTGRVIGNKSFIPNAPKELAAEHVLEAFLPQYYLSPLRGDVVIDRIILTRSLSDKTWLQQALRESMHNKLVISDKQSEKYSKWQSLADSNAAFALSQHLAGKNNAVMKLQALQKTLELPNPIQRIECFDVSHTNGESTVASCVVFTESGSANAEYRRYNIRQVAAGDDYHAMEQALLRRYTKIKENNGTLPDLLLIDGGKGQLAKAVAVFEELQISGVVLLAIAKGRARKAGYEQLFLPGKKQAIHLQPDSIAFHLLQYIRDEAHRFAITTHRKQRAKSRSHSPLENIDGIGSKRRQQLLQHFGGMQALVKASVQDIAKVNGISKTLAQAIYDALHGT